MLAGIHRPKSLLRRDRLITITIVEQAARHDWSLDSSCRNRSSSSWIRLAS